MHWVALGCRRDDDGGMETESVDVLIVGAGLSGIGAAYYLQRDHPGRSYLILEAREASGGTWDFFRFPGVRSDSDLHTFGYEFRPWQSDVAIADGASILSYLRETAASHGIDRHIRYRAFVSAASWSSADARWTVQTSSGARFTCRWLFCAAGYYRYDGGYAPSFPGRERFAGPVVHPQAWPSDLQYAGKRVLVIGSGSTAVTLVPALAVSAARVTMLQRTPSYVMPVPSRDSLYARLTRRLGPARAFAITRRVSTFRQVTFWRFCQRFPKAARRMIRSINTRLLPDGYPVDEHFNPPYGPWDQRLCLVPDGDLFRVIRDGRAAVVTGRIASFVEGGVQLDDGRTLEADVIVTATGLNVQPIGGLSLRVDDVAVSLPDTVAYKGTMLSGVPNFCYVFGYTNASWTLKVGLLGSHFSRLLSHMDARGYSAVVPVVPAGTRTRSLLDFESGYIKRALSFLPRQGVSGPWRTSLTYREDVRLLLRRRVDEPELRFSAAPVPGVPGVPGSSRASGVPGSSRASGG